MVLPQNDCSKISNWTSNFEYQKSNKINGIITLENESDIFDLSQMEIDYEPNNYHLEKIFNEKNTSR